MANGGNQRPAVSAAARVGQTLLPGKTYFFGSSDGRMRPGLKSADMLILIGVCVT
jgi:hypothetical protein